jgi:hypothetical protein
LYDTSTFQASSKLGNENGDEIYIGSVGGDVIGIGVKGAGNVISKNISVGDQQPRIPTEYVNSLKAFSNTINEQFKANSVPSHKVGEVQKNVDEFSKELEGMDLGEHTGVIKQTNLKSKLVNIAKAALTILPKTLQVLAAFTPLAPFSALIGEDTQLLFQAVQKEV